MKIVSVVGTRPNFIKISPFVEELEKNPGQFQHTLVHTGQHYDDNMSQQFFDQLGLKKPDINLEVGSASHARQTAKIMERFEDVCLTQKPDWVVVVGDVNSTMAATLVASKLMIKVAHIEAGLRSFDRTMPEEINRVVTDALVDLLFTPSRDGDENLLAEGVPRGKIVLVGNIMIDTLVKKIDQALSLKVYETLGLNAGDYVYVTLHRPGNVDDKNNLLQILEALEKLAGTRPVVFPIHPRTRQKIKDFGWDEWLISPPRGINLLKPVGYLESLCLTAKSRLVLTDSGGLQEESTYLKVPCLTLRPNTERPVTLLQGTNKLTTVASLWEDCCQILNADSMTGEIPEFWDGKTASRIVSTFLTLS